MAPSSQVLEPPQNPGRFKKGFHKALTTLKQALSAIEKLDASDSMHKLATFKACISERTLEICRQEVLKDAAQKGTLPEDVFLLTSLPQLQIGPAVVMLRELVGVSSHSICYRATDANTASMFLRVGRLEPTYKYAVSQAFGALYSRIGLPVEYEQRRDTAIKDIQSFHWG